MNRLYMALAAFVILGALSWATLSDPKLRLHHLLALEGAADAERRALELDGEHGQEDRRQDRAGGRHECLSA